MVFTAHLNTGAHRATGEVCLSPRDRLRARDSHGGNGQTAQHVRESITAAKSSPYQLSTLFATEHFKYASGTVEPLNNGRKCCSEVVPSSEVECRQGASSVSIVGRLSTLQSVHYQRCMCYSFLPPSLPPQIQGEAVRHETRQLSDEGQCLGRRQRHP